MPSKTIIQADIMAYLAETVFTETQAVVASIPDAAELPNSAREPWKKWFCEVADAILARVHPHAPVMFYQSDVRHEGLWIDKAFFVQQAAERAGFSLLSHRIVCRRPAGTATFGRSTYSHMLLFSQTLRNSQKHGYSDVIPNGGPAAWVRGIGLHSCEAIVRMIQQESKSTTLVHLFSGKGLLLEVAREKGMDVIGVDLSKKQCRAAQRFDLNKFRAAQAERAETPADQSGLVPTPAAVVSQRNESSNTSES
jgi:hypothetical protein